LWRYCEHSTRWLFSSHDLEVGEASGSALRDFIHAGGPDGRTRTEISVVFYKRNKKATEITAELEPLIHDGAVVEVVQHRQQTMHGRPGTRYVDSRLRINEFTNSAGQRRNPKTNLAKEVRTKSDEAADSSTEDGVSSYFVRNSSSLEIVPDLHSSSNSLIRTPGDPTADTLGMTDRVQQILSAKQPKCEGCAETLLAPQSIERGRCAACVKNNPEGGAA
jgi:hypothetical protein